MDDGYADYGLYRKCILWTGTRLGCVVEKWPLRSYCVGVRCGFHHSGFVNFQSDGYSLLIHKEPFHDVNVGVWYTLSAARIIARIFGGQTVNSNQFSTQILMHLFEHLSDCRRTFVFFFNIQRVQQVTQHTIPCIA